MSRPGAASAANLRRLFAPRHIAVFGGRAAAEVVRQCRALGFAGEIWPVRPGKETLEGLRCYPGVNALPEAPDASFIAVPREGTVEVVSALSARGAGGVICYASGFAEAGGEGVALQRQLVQAAGATALLGPNCYGMLNYLDGVALWPDQHGGERLARGVAIVTQSGNIGLNLTMQRRALPLAYLVTVGNKAGASLEEVVDALLQDDRVSAIGLHMEGLGDVAAFSRVALKALALGVPLVALKSGSSEAGARTTMSHTSSLAGPDVLYDALFARCGVARVLDPAGLVETLKLLHVHGALAGRRIASASCSGGEASLVADLAQPRGLDMADLPAPVDQQLRDLLGDRVHVANPLDYHTYIWGDMAAQTACFAALMESRFDMHLLVLDFPRADRCDGAAWQGTVDAWVAAHERTGAPACVLASMPEGLPDVFSRTLLAHGIAPMQGLAECMDALVSAALIGAAQRRAGQALALEAVSGAAPSEIQMLDEALSKQALAAFGLPVPASQVVSAAEAVACARRLGYPVVVKAVSPALAHKTEAGGVCLNLSDDAGVAQAVAGMAHLSDRFLVEKMVTDAVAELIVGVHRDAQFGLALTLGAGGVFVELLKDTVTLLLPTTRADVREALVSLKTWPLVSGYRSRPPGDVEALLDAVMAIAAYAQANGDCLEELDVNPLLVRPRGDGVLAVDAMIRISRKD
ncbi:MAG: acetate--CoA ligase family protein [Rhodoferax sp.]|nr:acetate--CoA ligase family protein [Rhodoferax sp.]